MVSCLDKLNLEGAYRIALQRVALSGNANRSDFFAELLRTVDRTPAREIERVKRARRIDLSRLDVTHPPTVYRIQLLQSRPALAGRISFSAEEEAQVEAELSRVKRTVQRKLVDWKLAHLND